MAEQKQNRNLRPISGWGRATTVLADEHFGEDLSRITGEASLTRGLGRSYGDASLPAGEGGRVANSTLANRILDFDETSGRIRVEAGFTLSDLNRLFLPRGYFTPVSPGTQFVTTGGMVASDVHGKGHHRHGTFGDHVQHLRMGLADGAIVDCSAEERRDLFLATLGGMGLTGHILEVTFRLRQVPSPWIWQEVRATGDLETLLRELERAADWPYTVGWMDCLSGRGARGGTVLIRGRWAETDEAPAEPPRPRRPVSVPFDAPNWLLSRSAARLNNWHYRRSNRDSTGIVDPQRFFYPLDRLLQWNRIYGKRGFIQYQNVLPRDEVGPFFEHLGRLGTPPFLCVIKDFGEQGRGLLSFPTPGVTLALDFPIDRASIQQLVDHMNAFTIKAGGRVYLSKDAFTRPEHFREMEPRLERWNEVRRRWDPQQRLRSALSVRLLGDRP